MQGNGDFVLADDPPLEKHPVKLELRENGAGAVSLVAHMDDGTEAYLAHFQEGRYRPFTIPVKVAQRLGLKCNVSGSLLMGESLSANARMGC